MSRKVKPPKFLMRDFSLNLWFILSISLILMILFSCAKEMDDTVYKDNHLKVKVVEDKIIIKNSNEVDVNIIVLNNNTKMDFVAKKWSDDTEIILMKGISKVFVECEYFEDNFEISLE